VRSLAANPHALGDSIEVVGNQLACNVFRADPSGDVMQQLGWNPFPRALACYRNPYGRMDLWIVVELLRVR
jgi:hypothetical protein